MPNETAPRQCPSRLAGSDFHTAATDSCRGCPSHSLLVGLTFPHGVMRPLDIICCLLSLPLVAAAPSPDEEGSVNMSDISTKGHANIEETPRAVSGTGECDGPDDPFLAMLFGNETEVRADLVKSLLGLSDATRRANQPIPQPTSGSTSEQIHPTNVQLEFASSPMNSEDDSVEEEARMIFGTFGDSKKILRRGLLELSDHIRRNRGKSGVKESDPSVAAYNDTFRPSRNRGECNQAKAAKSASTHTDSTFLSALGPPAKASPISITVTLHAGGQATTSALINSAAEYNFISQKFMTQNRLDQVLEHLGDEVFCVLDLEHNDKMLPNVPFLIQAGLPSGSPDVVLGMPWLQAADPWINWASGWVKMSESFNESLSDSDQHVMEEVD